MCDNVTDWLTDWLTDSLSLLKNTTTKHSEILVNLVKCYQSGGETLPNQQKDKDEDKDKDKDKEKDIYHQRTTQETFDLWDI